MKTTSPDRAKYFSLFTPIRWIEETSSTNSAALELARKENLDSVILAADHQTAGRGQFGRSWVSKPKENLLFSLYFKPRMKPSEASVVTQLACAAVVETLSSYQIACEVKKPNDVLIRGKKICGILTESSSKKENLEYIVVGIGLNVNSSPDTLIPEATSMKIEKQTVYNRPEILNRLIAFFETQLQNYFHEKN